MALFILTFIGEYVKIIELLKKMNGIINVNVLKYHSLAKSRYIALGMKDTMPDVEVINEEVNYANG